jgi:ferredoxin
VKDIRKMIGKMIWDAREDAEFELNCNTICQCPFCVVIIEEGSDSYEQSTAKLDDENLDECKIHLKLESFFLFYL